MNTLVILMLSALTKSSNEKTRQHAIDILAGAKDAISGTSEEERARMGYYGGFLESVMLADLECARNRADEHNFEALKNV